MIFNPNEKAGVTTPEELLRLVTEVREARASCPDCGSAVAADFVACPACGHRVGGGCPHCHRPLQAGWRYCPYCAKSTDTHRKPNQRSLKRPREVGELLAAGNVAEFKK